MNRFRPEITNTARCNLLSTRRRVPKFALGELVREPHGDVGVVDKVFADLDAAFDAGEIQTTADEWLAAQSRPPRTPKGGLWYGVILYDKPDGSGGSCLVGEDDLAIATS